MSTGKLFIISAPSGAGKTSLANALIKELSPRVTLKRVVTYTTRPPRPGEVDGIDYYFLSVADFEQRIEEAFFVEFSTVYGHYYGSPKDILSDMHSGLSYIMILDKSGALNMKASVSQARLIWVYTSSIQVLSSRLYSRNADDKDSIEQRLVIASQELGSLGLQGSFDYNLLNDDFSVALSNLKEIVLSEVLGFDRK